jgi:anti-sigma regulatory factor (Ser/Thr protein kinase)
MTTATASPAHARSFRHEALFYSSDDEFLAGTVPFILEGVDAGEAVLALVPEPRLAVLITALDAAAARVTFSDMRTVGHNPARIIPVWQDFVDRHGAGGRPVRGVGEPIWAGRGPDEIVECQIHESLLNVAFGDAGAVTILCPYEMAALDPSIGDEAHRSHPWVRHGGVRAESGLFGGHAAEATPFAGPLAPAPPEAKVETFQAGEVGRMRRLAADVAARAGLAKERADDLVLAVSEIVTNSVRHGGGSGTFAAWVSSAGVICEVADTGRIEHPLVGRQRPNIEQAGGRGLWLVNQLCDLVQIRVAAWGNTVRIHQHR